MIYWDIFYLFARMSLLAFGGALVVVPELHREVVARGWMSSEQFLHAFAIGQFVPGPNMAMAPLIGFQAAGVGGFSAAFLGVYGIPLLLIAVVMRIYRRYREHIWVQRGERMLRPLVIGLMLSAAVAVLQVAAQDHWWASCVLLICCAWASRFKKLPIPLLVLVCGVLWMGYKHWS